MPFAKPRVIGSKLSHFLARSKLTSAASLGRIGHPSIATAMRRLWRASQLNLRATLNAFTLSSLFSAYNGLLFRSALASSACASSVTCLFLWRTIAPMSGVTVSSSVSILKVIRAWLQAYRLTIFHRLVSFGVIRSMIGMRTAAIITHGGVRA